MPAFQATHLPLLWNIISKKTAWGGGGGDREEKVIYRRENMTAKISKWVSVFQYNTYAEISQISFIYPQQT